MRKIEYDVFFRWGATDTKDVSAAEARGSCGAADGGAGAVVELEKAWAVERKGGKLSLAALLRCRVRYLTDGAVIGGKAWMEDRLRGNAATFGRRKTPPRPMRGGVWGGLCSLRDLKKDVIG